MRSLFVSCALVLGCVSSVSAQTWIRNPANGYDYALTSPIGWKQAEAQAVKWCGHLVTIRNTAENAWLVKTFGTNRMWIGFTDEQKEGQWVWISGEKSPFTNWDPPGQPDNGGPRGNEDFAHLNHGPGPKPKWNDLPGKNAYPGIVERKLSPPSASYNLFGKACKGNAGTPSLAVTKLPTLGKAFELKLSNLPRLKAGVVFTGASDKIWNGKPLLPFDLSVIGMRGCKLLTSTEWANGFTSGFGSALFGYPIPHDCDLLGKSFFNQAFVIDPGANAFGVIGTNAGRGTVGT